MQYSVTLLLFPGGHFLRWLLGLQWSAVSKTETWLKGVEKESCPDRGIQEAENRERAWEEGAREQIQSPKSHLCDLPGHSDLVCYSRHLRPIELTIKISPPAGLTLSQSCKISRASSEVVHGRLMDQDGEGLGRHTDSEGQSNGAIFFLLFWL